MEALLLTMDLLAILMLCIGVSRVHRSGNVDELSLFAYLDESSKVTGRRERGAGGHPDA